MNPKVVFQSSPLGDVANFFYQQGRALFEDGKEKNFYAAIKKFKTALDFDPAHFAAWRAWGNTLFHLGVLHKDSRYLFDALEKYNKISPQGNLYWDIANAWLQIGTLSGEAVDFKKSLDAFSLCSSHHHTFWIDYGTAFFKLALLINEIGFLHKAADCFKKAVSLTLESFDGWFCLAKVLQKLYDLTHDEDYFIEANECYSAASGLLPYRLDMWHAWAVFLLEGGRRIKNLQRLESCLDKCQKGYALDCKNIPIVATWAEALAFIGELTDQVEWISEAQQKAKELLKLSDDDLPEICSSYGRCLFSFGNYFYAMEFYDQAIEELQIGLSLDRTRHQDWTALAQIYTKIGTLNDDTDAYEKAIRFYAKAAELQPSSTDFFDYGVALLNLADLKHDVSLLQRSMVFFDYHFQLYKSALHLHPEWLFQFATALDLLGDLQGDENLYRKAIDLLTQVVMLNPYFPHLHYRIGITYTHLGEATGDADYFHRAIHHFKLVLFKQEEMTDFIYLEWGVVLIHLADLTFDLEVREPLYREAELRLTEAVRLGNEQVYYQLACLYALRKEPEKALYYLQKSHAAKTLPTLDELVHDEWLDDLRSNPRFQEFLSQVQHKG